MKRCLENKWDSPQTSDSSATPDEQVAYFGECDGPECAWWNEAHTHCAAKDLLALNGIAGGVNG
jgi:hypothetical protein